MDLERRLLDAGHAQVRLAGAGVRGRTLMGYAAVFDSLSEDLGGFRERIRPAAFTRTFGERRTVVALVNHDVNRVLGSSANGTLALSTDGRAARRDPSA